MRPPILLLPPLLPALLLPSPLPPQSFNDIEAEPHSYYSRSFKDPFSLLLEKRDRGEADLGSALGKESVATLLRLLDIPVESQTLVFSKTSLQKAAVGPKNPRAIFFNEDVYLGWMPGGRIEIASMDPEAGAVLFFEDERPSPAPPTFQKPGSCIQCHAGSATAFLPGLLGRSTMTDPEGRSRGQIRSHEAINHSIPLHERWGGWFATGQHGDARHMANAHTFKIGGKSLIDRESGANQIDLARFFDTSSHLRPDSDIVALLVMDHQIGAHNILTEAHYRLRNELHKSGGKLEGRAARDAASQADRILAYLTFRDEAPLPASGVKGAGDFEKVFLARGKSLPDGSSLREFHLAGRLFKFRCSYMIYSHAFQSLPSPLKDLVLEKLHHILSADKAPDGFSHLADAERAGILAILKGTGILPN